MPQNTIYVDIYTKNSISFKLDLEEKMKIYSRALISELKSFIAAGTTYKAKVGQHDDLVSSLLLVIRMSVLLSEWDPRVFEVLKVTGEIDDSWEPPLPIYISAGV